MSSEETGIIMPKINYSAYVCLHLWKMLKCDSLILDRKQGLGNSCLSFFKKDF